MASLWAGTAARITIILPLLLAAAAFGEIPRGTKEQRDARMKWWREARFGLFIHWGLYAIPAGAWKEGTEHAEWILQTAQIPVKEYELFVNQFNPTKFDADKWARIAKNAGMKYIVITSKHHDGFCLFDSKHTDYDVMSTPFKRDIMKELSEACHKHSLKMCWYHSIMDWHHPDYLPRRDWESRSAEGADYQRYREHLKNQVRELLTNYGPIGVMWFDGEWEDTWKHEYGVDLYNFCRGIQPDVIVNNRVDVGRGGMAGLTIDDSYVGDFGTPEQEIPATGLPGVDWETCMTMNRHWGYNKHDHDWKSSEELIHMLADIASKGGNFLLNVGPTAEGEFPQPCVERLEAMGRWLELNGEAIYGTQASPFETTPWGRCTQKPLDNGTTRLYLHVFDWPDDCALSVRGITNEAAGAYLLTDPNKIHLQTSRHEDALIVTLPSRAPDSVNTVVVLDVVGKPDVTVPPAITAVHAIFVDDLKVSISSDREGVELRYTLNGSTPDNKSALVEGPIQLVETTTVSARAFRDVKPVSGVSCATFTKVSPRPPEYIDGPKPGLRYDYFEGDWNNLPNFGSLTPVKSGVLEDFSFSPRDTAEHFGFRYTGLVQVSRDGVYSFSTVSDDGSQLYIGDQLVVDNDGLHGRREAKGIIALSAGVHPITVTFFEKTGGDVLEVWYEGPDVEKQRIPAEILFRKD